MEFKLWEKETPYFDDNIGQREPTLTFYPADGYNRSCIIVCPGGGYVQRARHEGEPVALWLASIGISACVLNYRFAPYRYEAIMSDITRSVRMVRYMSEKLRINKNKVGVLGFSAGGHLASSLTVHFEDFEKKYMLDEVDKESSRPNVSILCYPVVSSDENIWHRSSFENLLGKEINNKELLYYFSSEKHISSTTPPVFIWHTADDGTVNSENSILFADKLKKNNVDFELHIYSNGPHGLGLAADFDDIGDWIISCEKWLKRIEFV